VGKKLVAALGAASLIFVGAANAEVATEKNANAAKPTVTKPTVTKPAVTKQAAAAYASLFESGLASVYCFRNGPTASGERSRPAVLTAAHKTLPFGTLVEVTNRQNGRSIVVRINDRGPFVAGRVIDLTPAAARALKFDGLAQVTLRVLDNRRDSRIVARAI
jgi:rare lipoprotein A